MTRVLVDATAIPANRGGVGRYLDGLLGALASDGSVSVVCQPRDAERYAALGLDVLVAPNRVANTAARLLWEQTGLPRLVRRHGFDVLHSPHYTYPVAGRFARVVTIHDLTFFTLPEAHSPVKRTFFRRWLRMLSRRSFPVIADSQATADEFTSILHADPARITVAHLGYDPEVFHVPAESDIRGFAASLTPPVSRWIAFLGTLEPRKNVPALIAAYRTLDDPPPLLLAGGPGWDAAVGPAVDAAVEAGFDVRRLGYLPIEQLSAFLGGAELVAYPSLGEGFGLPVLEAMATGAAVLTTRELSLPEVGGDAVAYSDTSADALADALRELLADDAHRTALGKAARERAELFTWPAAASAHLAAYARAAAP